MPKGSSSPAGTTQVVNPTAAAQLPFLQSGWQSAQNLYNTNPMPSANLNQAYTDLYSTGRFLNEWMRPDTNATYQNALTGGYGIQNSPAYPYFNQFATGTSGPQQTIANYGAQAAAGGGPGLDELAKTASGAYVGQNPYAASALQAAQDATTRGYQTATAPQTDANFANAGRYGSGALLGARGQNEQNLGTTLANQSNQFYNAQYQQERQAQDAAAQQYQQLRNAGLGLGLNAAGQNVASQQYGAGALQTGYQSGNQAALNALQYSPQILGEQFLPAQQQVNALTGLQNAPYDLLAKELSSFGQPTGPSGSSSQPYFSNDTANALSALTGAGSLANTLGGTGTLGLGGSGGLFSTGGLLGSQGALFGTAADASIAAGGPPLAAGAGKAAAAPFAAASDRRLKTDIRRLGELDNGLPVYAFRYKGDDQQKIGLMADEVEKVHPDAVFTDLFGFKMVDYAQAVR